MHILSHYLILDHHNLLILDHYSSLTAAIDANSVSVKILKLMLMSSSEHDMNPRRSPTISPILSIHDMKNGD
jgi:hypothetical protein